MKFTIGYISHNQEVHAKHLGPSLLEMNLQSDSGFLVVSTDSSRFPAENYNQMIELCQTPYLVLTHQDVFFSPDILERIEVVIEQDPDFGAIGMVGADSDGNYRWSKTSEIHEVDTLDCCFIVVQKDSPVRFNQDVFHEYHLYVEDYCAMQKQAGRKIYTISMADDSRLGHASHTCGERGPCWGNYWHFKSIFNNMWPGLQTT